MVTCFFSSDGGWRFHVHKSDLHDSHFPSLRRFPNWRSKFSKEFFPKGLVIEAWNAKVGNSFMSSWIHRLVAQVGTKSTLFTNSTTCFCRLRSSPQPLNPSTPQPLNPSTPQPLNPSTRTCGNSCLFNLSFSLLSFHFISFISLVVLSHSICSQLSSRVPLSCAPAADSGFPWDRARQAQRPTRLTHPPPDSADSPFQASSKLVSTLTLTPTHTASFRISLHFAFLISSHLSVPCRALPRFFATCPC